MRKFREWFGSRLVEAFEDLESISGVDAVWYDEDADTLDVSVTVAPLSVPAERIVGLAEEELKLRVKVEEPSSGGGAEALRAAAEDSPYESPYGGPDEEVFLHTVDNRNWLLTLAIRSPDEATARSAASGFVSKAMFVKHMLVKHMLGGG